MTDKPEPQPADADARHAARSGAVQTLTIRSLSSRRLNLRVALPQTGGAGLALTASPDRFRLPPGGKITIRVKASFQGTPTTGAPAEGAIEIGSPSTSPLRVP